jgi:ligand-binding sensor domain-containing protein/signal transduction histidine kinase
VRSRSFAAAVVGCLSLLDPAPAPAGAAGRAPPWLVVNTWSQKHGLPENTIRALLETHDGYLWIATYAGVARFDGARFTVFDDRDGGPLREIEVQALAEGRDGSLWLGTWGGGVTRLGDGGRGRVITYTKRDGLINDFVSSLCRDGDGAIWIGTDGGISRFENGRFRGYTTADGLFRNEVHALYRDPEGGIWAATRNGGLTRYRDGRFTVETIPGMPADTNVREMVRDRQQSLWLATHSGLFRTRDGSTRRYTTADGLSSDRLCCVHEDPAGDIWVASDQGLDRFRDGRFHAVTAFAGRGVSAVSTTRDGCVWAGSGTLSCLRESQFTSFTDKDGLPHSYTTTFLEDEQGQVWIGTPRGLGRWRDGAIVPLPADHGLPTGFVGGLALDRQGKLWVGTDAGVFRSRAALAAAEPRFERVPNQPARTVQARAMYVDREGAVWIGSVLEGVARHADGVFTVYTTKDGLLHDAVRGIVQDRDGNLWMGTRAGLNRFRDGKLTGYTVADGLAHPTIEGLYLARDDTLWIATRQGLNRMASGRLTTYTTDDGLLCNYINGIAEDDRGHMWMSCMRGVFRLEKRALDDFAAGARRALTPTAYGVEDGLPSPRASAGFDRSAYRTRDGRVWFATVRGASVVDPARLTSGMEPPPVHIEEVLVDQRRIAPGRDRVVDGPPGRGDLTIRYTAIGFVAAEKVRFRYRLEGYDADWVPAENRRAAYYSNIPPGRYTFQVTAASKDGVWNAAAATVDLHLHPQWYQTWAFRAAAALAALLLAAAAYRRHLRELTRRQRELERNVAERTAELAAANKELEAFSYSVSHDLRAPLRRIDGFGQALVERHARGLAAEGQEMVARMRQASASMEQLIDDMLSLARVTRSEMRRTRIDLGELGREIFDELRARHPGRAVELVSARGLEVSADPDLMRIALANLLGNAWKFTSKNPTATIELGVTPASPGGTAAFFVRDDGVGFDPAEASRLFTAFQRLHSPAEFEGTGVGLATVARVIERHGGRVWAEGQPGKGATFFFTVADGT